MNSLISHFTLEVCMKRLLLTVVFGLALTLKGDATCATDGCSIMAGPTCMFDPFVCAGTGCAEYVLLQCPNSGWGYPLVRFCECCTGCI
jgi:L-asparaginase II